MRHDHQRDNISCSSFFRVIKGDSLKMSETEVIVKIPKFESL